jgi:integrase
MQLSFGLLQVTLRYTYLRGHTIYYQRPVPKALLGRYSGKRVKHDLKTADLSVAEKAVALLNRRYEAEWAGLLAAPESSPASLKAHADAFLKARGLTPGSLHNHPMAEELLHTYIEGKRELHAGGDERVYRNAAPSDYLTPVELEAGRRLHGTAPFTLNDALELHLKIHPKAGNVPFTTYQRRAFAGLIAVTGDKAIADFKRDDARRYLEASRASGVTTATTRRLLGAISAVFATHQRENDLTTPNPFARLAIANEGGDSKKRLSFTSDELATLYPALRAKDDSMRWILAMLADTGARLAEVVGLPLDDIVIDADIPHVIFQVHPWRGIKGANGIRGVKDRTVPLVGAALWAAQRIKATALTGQRFAFPQYTSADGCKATHASGALNGWLRRIPIAHTCHDLRHTMKDRLRELECPHDIHERITGHGKKSVGDGYGSGLQLAVQARWLNRAALLPGNPASGTPGQ